jgi:hypothetical protein
MAFGSTATNGGGIPKLNIRKGIDSTWNTWYTILHSGNYTDYAGVPAGTKMLFVQTAAPSGWTKDTTYNNYALRITSGTVTPFTTGVAFTTAFASQAVSGTVGSTTATNQNTTATNQNTTATNQATTATNQATTATNQATTATNIAATQGGTVQNATLAEGQNGPHHHLLTNGLDAGGTGTANATNYIARSGSYGSNGSYTLSGSATVADRLRSATSGSGSAHNHGFVGDSHNHTQNSHNHTQDAHNHTQNAHNHTQDAHTHIQNAHTHIQDAHTHTFTGTAINLAVNYVDAIIATKN